jgi:quercetin dioxygenase-like cupin family protein
MVTLQSSVDAPVVLPNTQRPGYWLFGDHATFVATGEDTGGQFSLFDFFTLPQGGPIPHIHTRETEFAYILEGELSYQMHDQVLTATPGTFVYKPQDHLHSFVNLGTTPTRHLEFVIPSGIENLFAAIGQPGPETSPPPPQLPPPEILDRNFALLSQYGVEAADSLIFAPTEFNFTRYGTPTVTVLRPGSAEGAVSVTLAVSDGTEIPVNFADGERIQTVPIPITNNGLVEGNRTINLALTDPTGGAILGLLQDTAVLTIGSDSSYTLTNGDEPNDFPLLLPNTQRPSFWLGGENYSFIATGADTEGHLSLFDVFVPRQTEAESLISAPGDQAYYILDGNVTFRLGNQAFTATPNTFIYLPQGNPYALTNLGTAPARTLLFNPQSGLENFFAAVGIPGDPSTPPPTSVPEPSFIWGLLALVAWSAVSFTNNKLKHQSRMADTPRNRLHEH